jgi:hypothetical protein
MHEKPASQHPQGDPFFHDTSNQPFTPPIRHQNINALHNQSLRLQLLNASYVPGYFNATACSGRTPLRVSYVPGCFTPGM